jgi:hypothetical protein
MRLLYDPKDDVLDVIFDERLHRAENEKAAYRLRDGFMLYVTVDSMKPIQLTVVNYRRLAQLPVVHFNGWQALKKTDQEQLLPILTSPTLSTFLKLDPQTGYGHLSSPLMLEMFSLAA